MNRSLRQRVRTPRNATTGKCAAVAALAFGGLLLAGGGVAVASPIPAPAFTMSAVIHNAEGGPPHYSLGYTFTTSQDLLVTALGVMDIGGTSVAATSGLPVQLYHSASPPDLVSTVNGGHTSGDPVAGFSVVVTGTDLILSLSGGAYSTGDGFRYHSLPSPLVLPAGTYELVEATLNTVFGYQASGFATATGVGSPSHAVYAVPTNTADYTTNTADSNLPGDFGPNLLVSEVVPEPASAALLGMCLGSLLIVRRRRPLAA